MPKFIGLLRSAEDAMAGLSPAELQQVMERYFAWRDDLERAGNTIGGDALSERGRVIRRTGTELIVTNGPYVESSEIVGGSTTLEAADLDEAEKFFGNHPHLEFGSIEIRRIEEPGAD